MLIASVQTAGLGTGIRSSKTRRATVTATKQNRPATETSPSANRGVGFYSAVSWRGFASPAEQRTATANKPSPRTATRPPAARLGPAAPPPSGSRAPQSELRRTRHTDVTLSRSHAALLRVEWKEHRGYEVYNPDSTSLTLFDNWQRCYRPHRKTRVRGTDLGK